MPNLMGPTPGPSIDELTSAYRRGELTPTQVVQDLLASIGRHGADGTWICVADPDDLLRRAAELEAHGSPDSLPLFGVPFAVKDSIDVAGVPTTVACPEYAYVARETAPAVARLLEAGAIYVGKTNLDQFATGLTGTRTPYPIPRSVYGGDLVSGGSSSGSARAVATGQVPFALATDTAGSGRVPAALNGIAGFKPSRGLVSTVGLVPACRSLDCISVLAGRVADLARVLDVIAAADRRDPASRPRRRSAPAGPPRVGLPDPADLEFFGDLAMLQAHLAARVEIGHRFSTTTVPLTPFLDAGALLYDGPWVAERVTEFGDFSAAHPEAVHPVVRSILDGGRGYTAIDVFSAQHRLGELRAQVAAAWDDMDVLVLPAVGTTFTVAQVLADPVRTNTVLGHYTHFGNLLDLCAAVVPAGVTTDGRPAALMVLGPALSDDLVLAVAAALTEPAQPRQRVEPAESTAAGDAGTTTLVVVGHHLTGQPRSADLVRLGGVVAETTCTAPEYRLLKVGQAHPVPALLRVGPGGRGIEVETWTLPAGALAEVLTTAAPSLCLGRVLLADGRSEIGFVADASVTAAGPDVTDITGFGGWRAFLAAPARAQPALTTDAVDTVDTVDTVDAVPGPFPLPAGRVALVVIDMQRDFLLPGGFGETLGNDVSLLQQVVPPLVEVLASARAAGMLVVHTREGHLPDLSDCPPAKLRRGRPSQRIGDLGPHGRILVRGEYGHDIVDELAPADGEVVIDKPGKGAFHATDLDTVLRDAGITHLVVTGVTTEVCVHTTVREANDRGYEVLVLSDCVGSYFPDFQRVGLEMVAAQGGIFGWVADSCAWLTAVGRLVPAG